MVHYASLTYNSTRPQYTLQSTHFQWQIKSLPGLSEVEGLITAYIGCNSSLNSSRSHRICNFHTLIFDLDLDTDEQNTNERDS